MENTLDTPFDSVGNTPVPVKPIADKLGLSEDDYYLYGPSMAKVRESALDRIKDKDSGFYVLVTGITPTMHGEGKTTTAIGLSQALVRRKKESIACLRQGSQALTFGSKGGGSGGGMSHLVPADELNLHLTGDMHAVTAATNLVAAALYARIEMENTLSDQKLFDTLLPNKAVYPRGMMRRLSNLDLSGKNPDQLTVEDRRRLLRLDINPDTVSWRRVVDVADKFLRQVTLDSGGKKLESGFEVTAASEIMAVLSLATSLQDTKQKLSRMILCWNNSSPSEPVTADDLGVVGALMALLKDAILPTLLQSAEGTPVLIHTGPFGTIAHGCSSIIADKLALKLVGPKGFVITEAGGGSDTGAEKFIAIKCLYSRLRPHCAVIVASVRALRVHGGLKMGGEPSVDKCVEAVLKGCENLKKHIDNTRAFNVKVIVAINVFETGPQPDHKNELDAVQEAALSAGATAAVLCYPYSKGGLGVEGLAEAVEESCSVREDVPLKFLYELEDSIQEKIRALATFYGAESVEYEAKALEKIELYEKTKGFDKLPICMAKTHLSFSSNPKDKGVPKGFVLPILDVKACIGAGFICAYVSNETTMLTLPNNPRFYNIDMDPGTGVITGLE